MPSHIQEADVDLQVDVHVVDGAVLSAGENESESGVNAPK